MHREATERWSGIDAGRREQVQTAVASIRYFDLGGARVKSRPGPALDTATRRHTMRIGRAKAA